MRLVKRLLLLAGGVIIALLLAESVVKTFFPEYDPTHAPRYFHHNDYGIVLGKADSQGRQRKNTGDYDVTINLNRHGLRDPRDISSATETDWVVVGDSFAFGWGVAESKRFSSIVDKQLEQRVFNLAIPGSGLNDYLGLTDYALSRGAVIARLVVVLTVENDLIARDQAPAGPQPSQVISPAFRLKQWLSRYSSLYALTTTAIHGNTFLRDLISTTGLLRLNLDGVPDPQESSVDFDATIKAIQRIIADREVIVLVIPSRRLWLDGTDQAQTVHRRLTRELARKGVNLVDMAGPMSKLESPMALHFDNDGHWNENGHALAARALLQTLAQLDADGMTRQSQ